MSTEIFLLILCLVAITLLIIFRKTAFVKKYWRYALILIPAVFVLIIKVLATIRSNNTGSSPTVNSEQNSLKDEVHSIKEKLQEVNSVVKVEAAVAKTNNEQLMDQLKEVQKISDDRERRKRLAEMVG